jgi:glutamate dehydrogenase/leucine dehydrogenase
MYESNATSGITKSYSNSTIAKALLNQISEHKDTLEFQIRVGKSQEEIEKTRKWIARFENELAKVA